MIKGWWHVAMSVATSSVLAVVGAACVCVIGGLPVLSSGGGVPGLGALSPVTDPGDSPRPSEPTMQGERSHGPEGDTDRCCRETIREMGWRFAEVPTGARCDWGPL